MEPEAVFCGTVFHIIECCIVLVAFGRFFTVSTLVGTCTVGPTVQFCLVLFGGIVVSVLVALVVPVLVPLLVCVESCD